MTDVVLIIIGRDGHRKEVSLDVGETIVGRRPDCDLRVSLQIFSRRHFKIMREDDSLTIKDLNSSNGTMLNNKPLTQHEVKVKAGDLVKAGNVKFLFKIDGDSGSRARATSSGSEFFSSHLKDDSRLSDDLTLLEQKSDDEFFKETT
jgi:pSer/pThr/pTyr-binding forkhead associated (FHA) protein